MVKPALGLTLMVKWYLRVSFICKCSFFKIGIINVCCFDFAETWEGELYFDWGNGTLLIGASPTSFDFDQVSSKETFSGRITEFNFWNRTLNTTEIQGLLDCSGNTTGDIIEWTTEGINETLEVVGKPKLKEEDSEQWCKQNEGLLSSQILVPNVPVELGHKQCSSFNGKMPVPLPNLQNDYHQVILDTLGENVCGSGKATEYWFGLKWNAEKDAFVDMYTGEKPHPNITEAIDTAGEDPAEYGCINSYDSSLSSAECTMSWPCLNCVVEPSTLYFLKGLCPTAYMDSWQSLGTIDDTFRLIDDSTFKTTKFHGFTISQIFFNEAYERWTIQSLSKPDNILIMKPKNIHPLGRWTWIVGNKSNICPEWEPDQEIDLTFSACRKDQFTCKDGECIDINYRCNHNLECNDRSDEIGCELITFGEGYIKGIVPKETVDTPRNIILMVKIKSFPEINAIKLSFTMNFNLRMMWSDHRLVMNDLNTLNSMSNVINEEDLKRLWMPVLSFSNALGPFQTKLDEQTFGTIMATGNSTLKSKLVDTEGKMYSGADQIIILDKEYFLEFGCKYNLLSYPFDTQVRIPFY